MPSPFPGMDPYLEGSEWTSVHTELGTEIAKQLVPKVSPKYIVRPVRRFVVDIPEEITLATAAKRDTYPDTGVYKAKELAGIYETSANVNVPVPIQMATVIPQRVPVLSIEIRDTAERQLITAIEILSPTNKRSKGYGEYLDKRRRLLNSYVHLLEIDLLRQGKRVPMLEPLPSAPYFVFLSRAEERPMTVVWPIQLNMRLPVVPIPLLPEDNDVELDLQLALNIAYDAYRYDLSVDYTQPAEIPLRGEAAEWATSLLKDAGLTV